MNTFGQGRGVYISGLPYSFANSRLLYRAILWAASAEGKIHRWFSTNYNVEVHAYVKNGKYCVVNNTYEPQQTTVYRPMRSSGTRSRKETVCGRHRGRAWFPDGMPAKNTTGKKSRPPGQFLRPESRCVLTGISPLQCVW